MLHHGRPSNRAAKAYYEWPEGGKTNPRTPLGVLRCMKCGVMATLDVVIEKELVRVRAQANFVDLARPLVA